MLKIISKAASIASLACHTGLERSDGEDRGVIGWRLRSLTLPFIASSGSIMQRLISLSANECMSHYRTSNSFFH